MKGAAFVVGIIEGSKQSTYIDIITTFEWWYQCRLCWSNDGQWNVWELCWYPETNKCIIFSSSYATTTTCTSYIHTTTRKVNLIILRNVLFAYIYIYIYISDLNADYLLSPQQCALFLSIKYHNSYPTYIHKRITEIQSDYDLQILLYLVAVKVNSKPSLVLNKVAVMNNMKFVLAWIEEETARYLETFKALETKDVLIM